MIMIFQEVAVWMYGKEIREVRSDGKPGKVLFPEGHNFRKFKKKRYLKNGDSNGCLIIFIGFDEDETGSTADTEVKDLTDQITDSSLNELLIVQYQGFLVASFHALTDGTDAINALDQVQTIYLNAVKEEMEKSANEGFAPPYPLTLVAGFDTNDLTRNGFFSLLEQRRLYTVAGGNTYTPTTQKFRAPTQFQINKAVFLEGVSTFHAWKYPTIELFDSIVPTVSYRIPPDEYAKPAQVGRKDYIFASRFVEITFFGSYPADDRILPDLPQYPSDHKLLYANLIRPRRKGRSGHQGSPNISASERGKARKLALVESENAEMKALPQDFSGGSKRHMARRVHSAIPQQR
jgi:hypothetical protein